MNIRAAKPSDLTQILTILNEVSRDLQEKGVNQWNYPWDQEPIEDALKQNQAFMLTLGNHVIGTFFISEIDAISTCVIKPQSLYLNKIALLPEYQGKNYGSEIMKFALLYAEKQHKPAYLDCWAGNDRLKTFYKTHGFDYLGDYPEANYSISVFRGKS
ncbi:GNAT family N-acetyltransferase [Sporolactobacillus nakayamae]|uniref:Ribosomal protein S18 acetylase RimI n=1 Tax=Sporolactobacillus nakayamae TaxID=269670 RepID=A0A1I2QZL9_9BACL|nr:GNAT family N-acetyltransferase [Sporolactobacillus nakayamae]SFG33935.1 Ribosomal protein S18 acetylase RimI [Sporolactobacillus nakayamae]